MRTHIAYVCIILILGLAFEAWLKEHDARLVAEQTIQTAQAQVQTLQAAIASRDAATAQQLAALNAKIKAVQTPAQAIASIPDVSTLPLNPRTLPNSPNDVVVDATNLFLELSQAKQDSIKLAACQADLAATQQIVQQKDMEIKALTKKPSFFKRMSHDAKAIGIGILIGVITHKI